ncbi:hypothetical protein AVEN_11868-1 [Araneus ventricosus]|uniref:Uncharacterized protein n=1 Tax=Araneus ventricosus TaxID=182803 RepID=A0A4Y2BXQ3_ARAVE|nr:hypothetical protein AVEN_11868-1 [Araneus ventricosus]
MSYLQVKTKPRESETILIQASEVHCFRKLVRGLIRVLGIEPPEGRGPSVWDLGEGEKSGSESNELVASGCCFMRLSLSVRKEISLAIFILDILFRS